MSNADSFRSVHGFNKRRFGSWKIRQFMSRPFFGRVAAIRQKFFGIDGEDVVSFSVVDHCPMKCSVCPHEKYAASAAGMGMLSRENYLAMLDKIPRSVVIEICGASEPLLNKDTPQMLLDAYHRGHRVQLFTTLAGLTDDGAKTLSQIRFDKFTVHVPDGYYFKYPLKSWVRYARIFAKSKVPYICVVAMGDEVPTEALEALDGIKYDVVSLPIDDKNPKDGDVSGRLTCSYPCRGGVYTMVWPNGDVSFCVMDYGHQSVIGNLLKNDWNTVQYGAGVYRKLMNSGDCLCRSCNFAEVAR